MPTSGSLNYDASITNEKRSVRIYKDLNLNFNTNVVTKDIAKLTDVEAIKRSVRNLVQLNHYEKPFHPEIGSGVRELLFENANPLTSIAISQAITDVINNYEPRARLNSVTVFDNIDANEYQVTVNFTVVNGPPENVELSLTMELLR